MGIESKALIELGDGSDICPSCHSDGWKSARMVVLEGTIFSEGEIEGGPNEPGRFTGGFREFLLADRWFSWDKKFEADFTSVTTSGLVLAVRKHMLAYGSMVQLPHKPEAPALPSPPPRPTIPWLQKITPMEPRRPSELELLAAPVEKQWYAYFLEYLVAAALFLGLAVALVLFLIGSDVTTTGLQVDYINHVRLGAVALLVGLLLVHSLGANRRARAKLDQKNQLAMEKHQKALEKYEKEFAKYQSDCRKAEEQQREHEEAVRRYEEEREQERRNYEQLRAVYDSQLVQYQDQMQRVLAARELLWERGRVCLRCGTAYHGALRTRPSAG